MKQNDLGTDRTANGQPRGWADWCVPRKIVFNETTGARVTPESIKTADPIDKVHQFAETTASNMKVIRFNGIKLMSLNLIFGPTLSVAHPRRFDRRGRCRQRLSRLLGQDLRLRKCCHLSVHHWDSLLLEV